MSKKVTLPRYEQMILDVALMSEDELSTLIRCAKVTIALKSTKLPRSNKRKPAVAPMPTKATEQAS